MEAWRRSKHVGCPTQAENWKRWRAFKDWETERQRWYYEASAGRSAERALKRLRQLESMK